MDEAYFERNVGGTDNKNGGKGCLFINEINAWMVVLARFDWELLDGYCNQVVIGKLRDGRAVRFPENIVYRNCGEGQLNVMQGGAEDDTCLKGWKCFNIAC